MRKRVRRTPLTRYKKRSLRRLALRHPRNWRVMRKPLDTMVMYVPAFIAKRHFI